MIGRLMQIAPWALGGYVLGFLTSSLMVTSRFDALSTCFQESGLGRALRRVPWSNIAGLLVVVAVVVAGLQHAAYVECQTEFFDSFRHVIDARDEQRTAAASDLLSTSRGSESRRDVFADYLRELDRIVRENPLPRSECDH